MTPRPPSDVTATVQSTGLAEVRAAIGELFGAERRLRGREHQQGRDLTNSQLRALLVLDKEDEVTAGSLARSADLNPASVTAMLDQLEASGIVARRRSAEDRRVCMVSLTATGRAMLEERRAHWQALWEQHLGHLPDEELVRAGHVIRTIVGLLEEL